MMRAVGEEREEQPGNANLSCPGFTIIIYYRDALN